MSDDEFLHGGNFGGPKVPVGPKTQAVGIQRLKMGVAGLARRFWMESRRDCTQLRGLPGR